MVVNLRLHMDAVKQFAEPHPQHRHEIPGCAEHRQGTAPLLDVHVVSHLSFQVPELSHGRQGLVHKDFTGMGEQYVSAHRFQQGKAKGLFQSARHSTQYLIEQRRRFPDASGNFNAPVLDAALALQAKKALVCQGPVRLFRHHGTKNNVRRGCATSAPRYRFTGRRAGLIHGVCRDWRTYARKINVYSP